MTNRSSTIIVYGSYGYTGKLIVTECRSKNLKVILAGRNPVALKEQSEATGYDFEVVDTMTPAGLRNLLSKGCVVIHCGGPFQFTARAMVEACLNTQTHYTDITGEHQVFEVLANYHEEAQACGITILPGAGFDVVPSDCLALHLKNRLPNAQYLQLAFAMAGGGTSRGTARTMIEGLGYGSAIRVDGMLRAIPLGKKIIDVDFGPFRRNTLNIPWGDIATAWRSTGIPNIEVYMAAPPKMIFAAKLGNYFNWLLRKRWLKKILYHKLNSRPAGPDENRLLSSKSYLWGKVFNEKGEIRISTIETCGGYSLTAKTSVLIAEKIVSGNFKPGYQTPGTAYGADLILEIAGTKRIDTI